VQAAVSILGRPTRPRRTSLAGAPSWQRLRPV
jgi:hypothetical protein